MKRKILMVDDDRNLLSSYQRLLRKSYEVEVSVNADEGLNLVKNQGPFAVVVSDYKMPGMDGIQFLSAVKVMLPDAVRVILTGQADLEVAIDAVNKGNVFRFLTKPCPIEDFLAITKAAVEQHELIRAEKELLDNTLKGTIKILVDILSVVNPTAFRHVARLPKIARSIAKRMNLERLWEIELAALLSQIGCIAVPSDILERMYRGENLSAEESNVFLNHSQLGKKLLSTIPRLDVIAEAIGWQFKDFSGEGFPTTPLKGKEIPLLGRILKVALDFDLLVQGGKSKLEALGVMHKQESKYDPVVLAALEAETLNVKEGYVVRTVMLKDIRPGMVILKSIKDARNVDLIQEGQEINEVIWARLMNFARLTTVLEPIHILEEVQPD